MAYSLITYKFSLNNFIAKLLIFFICFPYIQIIPTSSYNQPYYILLAVILIVSNIKKMGFVKKTSFKIGFLFFLTGLCSFIINCYPYTVFQDYKNLLTYFSFFIMPVAAFYLCRHHKLLLIKFLKISIISWFIVGFIQVFINREFLTFLLGSFSSELIVGFGGGRGISSLAPEPTHFAFHIILLGIALYSLEKNKWYLILTIIQALLLAKSSSALLVITLGYILYLLLHTRRFGLVFFFITFFLFTQFASLISFIEQFFYEDSSRILNLIIRILQDPYLVFYADYSLNVRIGGMLVTFQTIFNDFFMPHSISQQSWTNVSIELLQKNRWLLGLSESQSPSGIGSVIFQIGFLFFPYLIVFVKSIYKVVKKDKSNIFAYVVLFISLSQFSLVAGDIGLVFGVFLFISSQKVLISSNKITDFE